MPEILRLYVSGLKGRRADDESRQIECEEDAQGLADARPGRGAGVDEKPNPKMVRQQVFLITLKERNVLHHEVEEEK